MRAGGLPTHSNYVYVLCVSWRLGVSVVRLDLVEHARERLARGLRQYALVMSWNMRHLTLKHEFTCTHTHTHTHTHPHDGVSVIEFLEFLLQERGHCV